MTASTSPTSKSSKRARRLLQPAPAGAHIDQRGKRVEIERAQNRVFNGSFITSTNTSNECENRRTSRKICTKTTSGRVVLEARAAISICGEMRPKPASNVRQQKPHRISKNKRYNRAAGIAPLSSTRSSPVRVIIMPMASTVPGMA